MVNTEKEGIGGAGNIKKMVVPVVAVVVLLVIFAAVYFTTQHQATVVKEEEIISTSSEIVQIPKQAVSTICRDVEAPFWAIDCNTALLHAYSYYVKKYGEVENYGRIGLHGLRVFEDRAYYVFGFHDRNAESPTCIVVNAINERDVREDRGKCIGEK